jgi:hypothetical protein
MICDQELPIGEENREHYLIHANSRVALGVTSCGDFANRADDSYIYWNQNSLPVVIRFADSQRLRRAILGKG